MDNISHLDYIIDSLWAYCNVIIVPQNHTPPNWNCQFHQQNVPIAISASVDKPKCMVYQNYTRIGTFLANGECIRFFVKCAFYCNKISMDNT